jgi:hypothetical protein
MSLKLLIKYSNVKHNVGDNKIKTRILRASLKRMDNKKVINGSLVERNLISGR